MTNKDGDTIDLPIELKEIFETLALSSREQVILQQELDETIRIGVFSTLLNQLPKDEQQRLRQALTGKSQAVQVQILQKTLAKRFSEKQRQEILRGVVVDMIPKLLDAMLTSATQEQRDKVQQVVERIVGGANSSIPTKGKEGV